MCLLQERTHGSWTAVGRDRVNRKGKARFLLDTDSPGGARYRAVVQRFRGAVPVGSVARDLTVALPPDTTPPRVPTGLMATAGDG